MSEQRQNCGHEWRNNDFDCLECIDKRIRLLEAALRQVLEGRFRYNMGDYESCAKNAARLVLESDGSATTSLSTPAQEALATEIFDYVHQTDGGYAAEFSQQRLIEIIGKHYYGHSTN